MDCPVIVQPGRAVDPATTPTSWQVFGEIEQSGPFMAGPLSKLPLTRRDCTATRPAEFGMRLANPPVVAMAGRHPPSLAAWQPPRAPTLVLCARLPGKTIRDFPCSGPIRLKDLISVRVLRGTIGRVLRGRYPSGTDVGQNPRPAGAVAVTLGVQRLGNRFPRLARGSKREEPGDHALFLGIAL